MKQGAIKIILENTPDHDEMGDLTLEQRTQFLVDHLRDAENTVATLRSQLDAAQSRVKDMEQLNLSTHDLKEAYKSGWIDWSGKAQRFQCLFKKANAAKRAALENRRAKNILLEDSARLLSAGYTHIREFERQLADRDALQNTCTDLFNVAKQAREYIVNVPELRVTTSHFLVADSLTRAILAANPIVQKFPKKENQVDAFDHFEAEPKPKPKTAKRKAAKRTAKKKPAK